MINKNWSFSYLKKILFSDGDFPSSHTTVSVTSVIVITPILYELICNSNNNEITLAVSIEIFLILWTSMTIRDALGVRMRVQELSQTVHTLLDATSKDSSVSSALQSLYEDLASSINLKAGHLPHEVIGGIILSIIFGLGANFIRTNNITGLIIDIIIAIMYFISSYLLLSGKIKIKKLFKK